MENKQLIFRASDHTYWLDGVEIPSVTRILDSVGLISPFVKNSEAAERGTVVHECCRLLLQGELDWSTVDPRLMGYVMSCHQFFENFGIIICRKTERSNYHPDYLYAGTYDLFLNDNFLIDYKTGGAANWHAIQTAAYAALIPVNTPLKRGTLYLQEDGSIAKLQRHTERSDWSNFLSCLNVYRLLERINGSSNPRH